MRKIRLWEIKYLVQGHTPEPRLHICWAPKLPWPLFLTDLIKFKSLIIKNNILKCIFFIAIGVSFTCAHQTLQIADRSQESYLKEGQIQSLASISSSSKCLLVRRPSLITILSVCRSSTHLSLVGPTVLIFQELEGFLGYRGHFSFLKSGQSLENLEELVTLPHSPCPNCSPCKPGRYLGAKHPGRSNSKYKALRQKKLGQWKEKQGEESVAQMG